MTSKELIDWYLIKKLACQAILIENHQIPAHGLVREPVKNYLADFVYEGGVPPLSAKGFLEKTDKIR